MTAYEKKLLANAREFVERTFAEVDGRIPSKKAVAITAKKIVMALRPNIDVEEEGHRKVS